MRVVTRVNTHTTYKQLSVWILHFSVSATFNAHAIHRHLWDTWPYVPTHTANKSVLSLVSWLPTWRYLQPQLGRLHLVRGASSSRSISAARVRAVASSKRRLTGQTDTRPLHRHCIAYYMGSVNKASGLWVIFTTRCYDSALLLVSVAKWLAHLTAVWEDSGLNHATDSCVYCDSCCDIQSWARAVHLYCSA